MKFNTSVRGVLFGACFVTFVGCAHKPPAELTSARAACKETNAGTAARLVPVELHLAQVMLAKAEKSFADTEDSYQTRDLAYVALRKCQMADALATTAASQKSKTDAKDDYSDMQGQLVEQTKADLGKTKADLDKTQAALMAALAKLAEVKEDDRGVVITLSGSVLFRTGEAVLLPQAQTKLDQVAEALLSAQDRYLSVEGHTDSEGGDTANLDLSRRRAEAVRTYLVGRGYPADHIVTEGLGEGRPVAENNSPEGRSNNRRVEIIIQRDVSGRTGTR